MTRPLLLACTQVYPGPWVPTSGSKGEIVLYGLKEGEDVVRICIRDTKEEEPDTVITVDRDMEMTFDLKLALIRAEVIKSSGAEIYVWLR